MARRGQIFFLGRWHYNGCVLIRAVFPRPSQAAVEKARTLLHRRLGPSKILTEPDACLAYGGDESEVEPVAPDAVVLASCAEDIENTLAVAREAEVPVVPRAAGSGKSGGAVPVMGGIVLSVLGMQSVKEINTRELVAVVEPGVILGDFHAAVEREGLFYPPDPNSAQMCALGGNIAENAAGPRAFKYGATRDYVLGLEVIAADGTRLRTGKRTTKGVTGYDITALLVGSEGTLAITTEATLRLIPKPAAVTTLLALFSDVMDCGRAVSGIVASRIVPRCIELCDEAALGAVRSRGVPVDERAKAMLIIEVDGDAPSCELCAERVGNACALENALEVLVAQDEARREKLWDARRKLSAATRAMAKWKVAEDVVVPRPNVPELLREVAEISERTGVFMLSYGHAGDGNLHVNFLWNDPADAPRVEKAMEQLFVAVLRMRGTLSGEHGIGISKAKFLPLEQSEALIELQKNIKKTFDPKGLLNPGKIFPRTGHGSC